MNYKSLANFFKGIASAGAYSCFDEFNRIGIDVLSVVAQHILTIQRAISEEVDFFELEGVKTPLNPSCAIFITMNPDYAGTPKQCATFTDFPPSKR